MKEFKGLVLVLTWLLFKGGRYTCAENSVSICFSQNSTASYVCKAQSLSCQQTQHILLTQIKYYTVTGGENCNCTGTRHIWNIMDPPDLIYELYIMCSFKSQCNFSSVVYIEPRRGRDWLAVVEYECIQSELSKDMCNYLLESYGKNSLYLQLSHHSDIHHTSDCTCAVPENSSIVIVHYRSSCKANVFVNAEPLLPWANASIGIFNYSLDISETKTPVTFYPWNCTPELLWIRVLKPINSTLCCNCDRNATETNATTAPLSTVTAFLTSEYTPLNSTVEGEFTLLHSSTIKTTIETTNSTSSEITRDITPDIASQSPKEISSDSSKISSAAIIGGGSGGIVFVILVVAVVCVVIKRKRSIPTRASGGNEAYTNTYFNKKKTAPPIANGVVNLSYEDQTMHGDRELLHSNDDGDVNDVNEYTDPFDVSASPPNARATGKIPKDVTNKLNNMYEESYNGPTVPESRSLSVTYAKPLKLAAVESPLVKSKHREDYLNNKNLSDASEYSHLATNSHSILDDAPEDQYNHIHDVDDAPEDQYNHIHDVDDAPECQYNHIHDVENAPEDQYNHIHDVDDAPEYQYNHIHDIDNAYLTKGKDNYSHTFLKSTKPRTDEQQTSACVEQYSHLDMHVFNNSTSSDEEKDNHALHNYYNVDIMDQDHVSLTEL